MDFDRIRKRDRDKARMNTIRERLLFYGKDMRRMEAEKEKIEMCRDRLSLGASWSSSDAVKGGGSSQEELQVKIIDKINECERNIKVIELENRAMTYAIEELDSDKQFIIRHMWMVEKGDKRFTYRDCGSYLKMSKDTAQRRSDAALLEIFEKLYLIEGGEVDVR